MFLQEPLSLISVLILAILPSLIWLFFYLKEDDHPEPKYWLFIIFLIGIASAPLVIFLEMVFVKIFHYFQFSYLTENAFLLITVAPFIEETVKYGIVHLSLNKNPVLDEPVDAMIYVISAALGFAAIENALAIFSFVPFGAPDYLNTAFNFVSLRFVSATALHGLASGITGYFFAYYYFFKKDARLIFAGLFIATVFHGLYNFFITQAGKPSSVFLTGVVLGCAAILVIYLFNRLKHYRVYQEVKL